MGQDAWQMIGRTPGYIVAVRPLRGGAITDFDITQRMIRLLLQRSGVSPLQPSPRAHLRAVRHHRGRAAGGQGGGPPGGCLWRLPDRAADGGGHRCRPAHPRTARQHGRRRRRRHDRDGGHLPRRHRGPPGHSRRQLRHRRRRSRPTSAASTASPSASAPPRRSRSPSARPTPSTTRSRPRSVAAT